MSGDSRLDHDRSQKVFLAQKGVFISQFPGLDIGLGPHVDYFPHPSVCIFRIWSRNSWSVVSHMQIYTCTGRYPTIELMGTMDNGWISKGASVSAKGRDANFGNFHLLVQPPEENLTLGTHPLVSIQWLHGIRLCPTEATILHLALDGGRWNSCKTSNGIQKF